MVKIKLSTQHRGAPGPRRQTSSGSCATRQWPASAASYLLPRTRLWRLSFQYKFAKKKRMGMCFCWLDWQRNWEDVRGTMMDRANQTWDSTRLTRKIQAEIRKNHHPMSIKHNHREKCRIHHDPKTHPRQNPTSCMFFIISWRSWLRDFNCFTLVGAAIFGGGISQNFLADAAEASRFGAQNVIPNIGGREIPESKRARSSASHRDSRDRELVWNVSSGPGKLTGNPGNPKDKGWKLSL